jgi:Fe2+ or Zn2+ uptake regulation protein
VIDELAKSMPRPAPITVYRALDFLMENGLVHRIESRNAFLACAHDHDATSMVAFLICERCGSVGEIRRCRWRKPQCRRARPASRRKCPWSKSPAPARTARRPLKNA